MPEKEERGKDRCGAVYFVGAGPGAPDLITVRGRRLLQEADLVVYAGSLVDKETLSVCRKDARLYDSAPMELEAIMDLLITGASAGEKVVRLHTGDPTFYSALSEQTLLLEDADIPYEVVPGVSSAFASAAALKSELTTPGITQTVMLTRIEGRTPVPEAEKLAALAAHGTTLCIFLSTAMIEKVVEELRTAGLAPETPAAVVYRASWPDEESISGTLEDIAAKTKNAGIKKQAMIIVSRTLDNTKGERSKLYDKDFEHEYRKR